MKTMILFLMATMLLPTLGAQDIRVGLPERTSKDNGQRLWEAMHTLILGAPNGSRIVIYNARTQDIVTDIPIPEKERRLKRLSPNIEELRRFLNKSVSVRDGRENEIKIPQFMDTCGGSFRSGSGDTRILLFGNPYYLDERDKDFVYGGGWYLSDGHPLADSKHSLFGCADKQGLLAGCTIDFCYLDHQFSSGLEETRIKRFLLVYMAELGATLSTFHTSEKIAVKRALKGATDPVSKDKIDRSDTKMEKRPADAPTQVKAPTLQEKPKVLPADVPQAPVQVVEAVDTPKPSRTVVIVTTDGSMSSEERIVVEQPAHLRIAEESAKSSNPIEFGIVVFRGKGQHDSYPPVPLRLLADGSPGPGLKGFRNFFTAKDLEVDLGKYELGSEVGISSGRKVKVSRMEPLGAAVDTAFGLREGLRLFGSTKPSDLPILVFCGDCDCAETHKGKAVAVENQKLVEEVRAFALLNPRARVVSVYSGTAKGPAQAFFKDIAGAAGDRGVYLDRIETLESVMRLLLRPKTTGSR